MSDSIPYQLAHPHPTEDGWRVRCWNSACAAELVLRDRIETPEQAARLVREAGWIVWRDTQPMCPACTPARAAK